MTKKLAIAFFLMGSVLFIQMGQITRPYSGHFASYQANGLASIARNMLRENFSEWYLPKTDMIVGGKRSLHLNAYPFPSLFAAIGIKVLGGTLEFWGRFQAIFFNLLCILLVGWVAGRWFNPKVGWAAAAVYAFSPFALIYGQGFFFEPSSLFFLLLSIFLITGISEKEPGSAAIFLSGLFFSVAVTERLHFVLLYPALLLHLFIRGGRTNMFKLLLFTLPAFAMPVSWYAYTYYAALHARNVHTNLFLQATVRVWQDKPLLLSLPYYLRLFDIVSGIMLTPLLFFFPGWGLLTLNKQGRPFWILASYLFSGSLIVLLAPEKMMEQDFYLAGIFPFLAMAAGLGLVRVWEMGMFQKKAILIFGSLILYLGVSSRYFLHPIFKGSENIGAVMQAAQTIQTYTNSSDFLVVAGKEPTLLAYYADRPHWVMNFGSVGRTLQPYHKAYRFSGNDPTEFEGLEAAMKDPVSWVEFFKKQGAKYFATAPRKDFESTPVLLEYLREHAQIISQEKDDFYLFRLEASP